MIYSCSPPAHAVDVLMLFKGTELVSCRKNTLSHHYFRISKSHFTGLTCMLQPWLVVERSVTLIGKDQETV